VGKYGEGRNLEGKERGEEEGGAQPNFERE
jgi:hypothetical protein